MSLKFLKISKFEIQESTWKIPVKDFVCCKLQASSFL